MSKNYYLLEIPGYTGNPIKDAEKWQVALGGKQLIGSEHFTGGKARFTFLINIGRFIELIAVPETKIEGSFEGLFSHKAEHLVVDENDKITSLPDFISSVLSLKDIITFDRTVYNVENDDKETWE